MNVADKRGFFGAIARHLRPGAGFACFEVCRTGAEEPPLPLPWSLDGTDSFLATPEELHTTIASCGFDGVEWVDETEWVRSWFAGAGARGMVDATTSPVTLPALLVDGPTRLVNYAVAIMDGVVGVYRGSFTRCG